jgi:hypothetical protein
LHFRQAVQPRHEIPARFAVGQPRFSSSRTALGSRAILPLRVMFMGRIQSDSAGLATLSAV